MQTSLRLLLKVNKAIVKILFLPQTSTRSQPRENSPCWQQDGGHNFHLWSLFQSLIRSTFKKLFEVLDVVFIYGYFVCLGFIVPLENCSLTWRRHHYRWKWTVANFDLCSAHMTIGQWGFLSVPHILWHGASVNNGHLRGPVTLKPTALSSGAVTTLFNDLSLSRLGFEHRTFRLRG